MSPPHVLTIWPTNGWDLLASLRHPGKLQRVSRLAALLHGTLVVGVSQSLGRWTEGATCILQGGHHVGNWPTFLVKSLLFWFLFQDAVSVCVCLCTGLYRQQRQQQQQQQQQLRGTTWVSQYQKKHSPTHHDHHPVFISFHLPQSIASSLFKLRAWQFFAQSLSMSSLFYLLVWSPPPHIPYISSPNQCLLFAAHAHTIASCFAVVSILYHLFLVFLSTPYLELLYLNITHPSDHSYLCSLKCHLIFFPDRPKGR